VVDYCINGGPGKIHELVALGALAIGEIFTYEHSESDLLEVLRETEEAGALATIHAEDGEIIKEQTKLLEDLRDPVLYSSSRPPAAEARAIGWVLNATKRAHICHLSTGQGLDIIRQGRKAEKQVTCEVTPHHLLFNRRDYRKWGSFLKINPPLREARDNDALWQGLRAGEIDIIASDHAPHLPEEKRDEIWSAPAGVPGVETMLPLILSLVKSNFLSLDRAVDALSAKPAEIFGLQSKGTIARGKDADLVLFDPRSTTRIRADRLHSRAEWTPYEGRYGIFPKLTLVRGRVVYDGDIEVKPGFGKFLPGPGYQRERVFEEE
jgi:dihydroorotase